jgi:hypothetical protein
MSWIVGSILFATMLVMAVLAVRYFASRRSGKTRLAVAAVTGIVAVWSGYASILSINWVNVAIVFLLRRNPDLALQSTNPNWQTTVCGLIGALTLSYLIYRLAIIELRKNRLPLNASALELEEPGRKVGVFELTQAHVRYLLAGKADRPITNPGESAYQLCLERRLDLERRP